MKATTITMVAATLVVLTSSNPLCSESKDRKATAMEKQNSELEQHILERHHGDVCRIRASNAESSLQYEDFFCPKGCEHVPVAPFCAVSNDVCADSPDKSVHAAMKAGSELEVHDSEPTHGDVCRVHEGFAFFCPAGCRLVDGPPYCAEAIHASLLHLFSGPEARDAAPCRVRQVYSGREPCRVGGGNGAFAGPVQVAVKGLPSTASSTLIRELFSGAGVSFHTAGSTAAAAVTFGDLAHARAAVRLYDGKMLLGSEPIVVKLANAYAGASDEARSGVIEATLAQAAAVAPPRAPSTSASADPAELFDDGSGTSSRSSGGGEPEGVGASKELLLARIGGRAASAKGAGAGGTLSRSSLASRIGGLAASAEADVLEGYRSAAEHGYANAQYNLGAMYAQGRGVEQDFSEALRLLRLAQAQGVEEAASTIRHVLELQRKQSLEIGPGGRGDHEGGSSKDEETRGGGRARGLRARRAQW